MARTWITKVNNVDTVDAAHVNDLQTYKLDKDELPWVRPEMYGAVGDGVHDDTVAIQAAVNAATGGIVLFSEKTYLIDSPAGPTGNDGVIISNPITMLGMGPGSIIKQSDTSQYCFFVRHDGETEVANVTIDGLWFEGPTTRQDPSGHVNLELYMQVAAIHVKDFTVKNCVFHAMQGDGLCIGLARFGETVFPNRNNENINILNNIFDGYDHNQGGGILIGDGTNVLIQGNTFRNLSSSGEPGSIDIEGDPYPYAIFKNIQIVNNKFSDTNGFGGHIQYYLPTGCYAEVPSGLSICGNIFSGDGAGVAIQIKDDISVGISIIGNFYKGNNIGIAFGYGTANEYLNDVIIADNIIDASAADQWSLGSAVFLGIKLVHEDIIRGLDFRNNQLLANSHSAVMILGGSVDGANITGNVFSGGNDGGLIIGNTAATIVSGIVLNGNRFTNIDGIQRAVYQENTSDATHRTTHIVKDNIMDAGLYMQFPSFRTDISPDSTIGTHYPIYDETPLPDSFPIGRSVSPNPDISGFTVYPGVLITEKYSNETALRGYIIQWYIAANTDSTSMEWVRFRKANSGANTWGAWTGIDQAIGATAGPTFDHIHLTTGPITVAGTQVVGAQATAQANLKADYTTGDLDSEAEIIAAINATNAGFNTLLAKLRTHGLIDT